MASFITLADLKAHLNITIADDDDLLTGKAQAATDYISAWLDPAIVATWTDPVSLVTTIPGDIQEATRKLAADFYEQRQIQRQQSRAFPRNFMSSR